MEGDTKYRLPSEAEWEYACRSGGTAASGIHSNKDLKQLGWYKANAGGRPHDVATRSPNELELYDMKGNVWEWCRDWWERWYGKFSGDAVTDPVGPSRGLFKVYRGGGWFGSASYQRCASRMRGKPNLKSQGVGFRVARSE
jgi:formylglycine-generating enzyme required for sulfatase activity